MNNTTSNICANNFGYDKSLYISNIVWRLFGFLGITFGVTGHVFLIIILLNKTNRKDPTSLYIIVIGICELIFLMGIFWLWCVAMSLIRIDPREIIPCGIFYSILTGSTSLSNLYLASLSIDRGLIILSPTHYRLLVTRPYVIFRLIFICLIIILLLIPHHFYLYYDPKSTLSLCEFRSSVNHQRAHLWALVHAILFVSIPALIVCISSLILLHNRCKHNRIHKKNLSLIARRMQRNSIFIFLFSIGIFLFLLPACILQIFIIHDRFFYHNMHCSIRWKIYKILLNCFLTLTSINYSIKFYIHLVISTSFQRSFIQLITCKYRSRNIMNYNNKTEQRLTPLLNQNKARQNSS